MLRMPNLNIDKEVLIVWRNILIVGGTIYWVGTLDCMMGWNSPR